MATLSRFWIEFEDETKPPAPGTVRIDDTREAFLRAGCGVTAWDLDDALDLIASAFADRSNEPLPSVVKVIENVDVSSLPDRVTSFIGVTVWRGVWSPPHNLSRGPES